MDDTPDRVIQVHEMTFPDGSKVWYWREVDANNSAELPRPEDLIGPFRTEAEALADARKDDDAPVVGRRKWLN
jgi:hypothetical protein